MESKCSVGNILRTNVDQTQYSSDADCNYLFFNLKRSKSVYIQHAKTYGQYSNRPKNKKPDSMVGFSSMSGHPVY